MESYRPLEDFGDEPAIEERMGPSHLDWLEVMEALEGPPIITFDSAYWDRVLESL